jgi:hypothetical protein
VSVPRDNKSALSSMISDFFMWPTVWGQILPTKR